MDICVCEKFLSTCIPYFMMYINELCVSPARICPSLDFWGSWGNFNVNYLFDLFVPPFGSPTIIGGLLAIVCSWELLGLM